MKLRCVCRRFLLLSLAVLLLPSGNALDDQGELLTANALDDATTAAEQRISPGSDAANGFQSVASMQEASMSSADNDTEQREAAALDVSTDVEDTEATLETTMTNPDTQQQQPLQSLVSRSQQTPSDDSAVDGWESSAVLVAGAAMLAIVAVAFKYQSARKQKRGALLPSLSIWC